MSRWKTAIFAVLGAVPLVAVMNVGAPAQASSVLSATPAQGQHQSTTLTLPPAQCRAANASLQQTGSVAAPMKNCEVAVDLVVSPASASPEAAAAGWYTYTETVTACWGAGAYFGGKNGSFSCGEGYVQMTYQFATNGSWLNMHWITPKYGTSPTYSVTRTWKGTGGNNSSYMTAGVDWNWGDLLGSGTVQLRAANWPCGGFKVCALPKAYWQS
jgi:hypothetical protein